MAGKRRGKGEGSISRRQDGRWQAVLDLGRDATGKRQRHYFYGETRREVQEALKQALREQEQGVLVGSSKQTLEHYLSHWLESAVRPSVKASTYAAYQEKVRLHVLPTLGGVKLSALSAQHLQGLYRALLEKGLAPASVRVVHAVLHRALKQAVKWGLLGRNVAELVDLPREERYEARFLNPEQARVLLGVAQGHRFGGLMVLALTTAMRRGELLGLAWEDVDLEAGIVRVTHTQQRIEGKVALTETKTRGSRRFIPLTDIGLTVLRRQRAQQAEARLRTGKGWQDSGRVFTNLSGGPLQEVEVGKALRVLLAEAGLPRIRFHDLRHSCASLLLALGVHPKVVAEILGHSSISMTLDQYSHVGPSLARTAMADLNRLLQGEISG